MITINENGFHKTNSYSKPKEIKNPYYISDPELFKIYQKSLPPPEAYLYFPKDEEIIILNSLKPEKSLRRIFSNVPLYDFEINLLIEFNKLINSHPELKLPDYWNNEINLRFIHATECNINKSYERLVKYLHWYNNTFPMEIHSGDKIYQLLNMGFLYVHGRDCHFRPIIVCQPSICIKYLKFFEEKDIIDASIFLFQFIVNNMFIPGQIENWVMIINFEGSSVFNIPDIVKKIIKTLSENFLSRLYKCYVYGMSLFINFMFKIICTFLEEVTVQKINIINKDNMNKIYENIRQDNLEEKFGGTAPNMQEGINNNNILFPPKMPSSHFILDSENPKDILITKEEYIKLVLNNKIRKDFISPYLIDEIENIKKEEELQLKLKNQIWVKQWKIQNEFEGKNKIKNLNSNNYTMVNDLNLFNIAKHTFYKSINKVNGNK